GLILVNRVVIPDHGARLGVEGAQMPVESTGKRYARHYGNRCLICRAARPAITAGGGRCVPQSFAVLQKEREHTPARLRVGRRYNASAARIAMPLVHEIGSSDVHSCPVRGGRSLNA